MNRAVGLFLANLIFSIGFAQDHEQTLLWKIEKEGAGEAYLFGTIHVLPQSDFTLEEKVRQALDDSDELVMELDMSDPGLQMRMMQLASMSDGRTLDELMSEEDYALVDSKLRSVAGTSLATFNTYKPFMVATLLLREYVGSQPASFELALMSMASQRDMPISGLESLELQMAVFDSISYESQVEDLVMMVRDSVEMQRMYREMIEEYKAEDYEGLYASTEGYFDSDEMKYLLYERNENWVEIINDKFGESTPFFAVGSAHLGGEKGLIKLLKEKGLNLYPIPD